MLSYYYIGSHRINLLVEVFVVASFMVGIFEANKYNSNFIPINDFRLQPQNYGGNGYNDHRISFVDVLITSNDRIDSNHSIQNIQKRRYLVQQNDKANRLNQKKLQQCKDSGEAYSAAYLIHKDHLLNQFTNYNLTWVNCEMG